MGIISAAALLLAYDWIRTSRGLQSTADVASVRAADDLLHGRKPRIAGTLVLSFEHPPHRGPAAGDATAVRVTAHSAWRPLLLRPLLFELPVSAHATTAALEDRASGDKWLLRVE